MLNLSPPLAGLLSLGLIVLPWSERNPLQYEIAAYLLGLGVVLWALTWLANRGLRAQRTGFRDVDQLDTHEQKDPRGRHDEH